MRFATSPSTLLKRLLFSLESSRFCFWRTVISTGGAMLSIAASVLPVLAMVFSETPARSPSEVCGWIVEPCEIGQMYAHINECPAPGDGWDFCHNDCRVCTFFEFPVSWEACHDECVAELPASLVDQIARATIQGNVAKLVALAPYAMGSITISLPDQRVQVRGTCDPQALVATYKLAQHGSWFPGAQATGAASWIMVSPSIVSTFDLSRLPYLLA